MSADERELLLRTARLLAELVIWKNTEGRYPALELLDVAKRVAAYEETSTPSNPSGDGSGQNQVSSMDADRGGEPSAAEGKAAP